VPTSGLPDQSELLGWLLAKWLVLIGTAGIIRRLEQRRLPCHHLWIAQIEQGNDRDA